MATQLIFGDSGGSVYGNVSIVWLDDREGHYTLAGLTEEEADHICADLEWTYLSLFRDIYEEDAAPEDFPALCSTDFGDWEYDDFCEEDFDDDDEELEEEYDDD